MQRTVELDEAQIAELERLAIAEHQTIDTLVRRAVDDYLARQSRDWTDWSDRLDALTSQVQSHLPPDVTTEEIEADITAARAEVWTRRTGSRADVDAPDSGRR